MGAFVGSVSDSPPLQPHSRQSEHWVQNIVKIVAEGIVVGLVGYQALRGNRCGRSDSGSEGSDCYDIS